MSCMIMERTGPRPNGAESALHGLCRIIFEVLKDRFLELQFISINYRLVADVFILLKYRSSWDERNAAGYL
jgi:hypothetical protein